MHRQPHHFFRREAVRHWQVCQMCAPDPLKEGCSCARATDNAPPSVCPDPAAPPPAYFAIIQPDDKFAPRHVSRFRADAKPAKRDLACWPANADNFRRLRCGDPIPMRNASSLASRIAHCSVSMRPFTPMRVWSIAPLLPVRANLAQLLGQRAVVIGENRPAIAIAT